MLLLLGGFISRRNPHWVVWLSTNGATFHVLPGYCTRELDHYVIHFLGRYDYSAIAKMTCAHTNILAFGICFVGTVPPPIYCFCACHACMLHLVASNPSRFLFTQGGGLLSENQARMNTMRHTVQKLQTVLHVDRAVNNTEWLLSNRSGSLPTTIQILTGAWMWCVWSVWSSEFPGFCKCWAGSSDYMCKCQQQCTQRCPAC